MPPEILAKLESNQIKIFRGEEKDNLENYQNKKFGNLNSKGDYVQDFQTNFDDNTNTRQYVQHDEISQLKQENSILNKILSNFFPENKSVVKRNYSPTVPPIFKTTSKHPAILFPNNQKDVLAGEGSTEKCTSLFQMKIC